MLSSDRNRPSKNFCGGGHTNEFALKCLVCPPLEGSRDI